MDLKSFLPVKEKEKEYFWSVVIESDWIQAGIWYTQDGQTEVISVGPATPWKDEAELISAADTALSAAVQALPEDAGEPTKTVFGVSSSWVKDGQIAPQYLEKLKKLCSELSLVPTGFVVLAEAIAHIVKSEEGTPLGAIVVGLSSENLEISIFKKGKLEGNSQVARSVSVTQDIEEGLARFSSDEAYPSRIILYDGKEGELEDTEQELLKTPWENLEKIKFLHTPKIEIFPPDKKVLAVSLAGASEVSGAKTVEKKFEEEKELEVEENIRPTKDVSAEELGFAIGEDIAASSGQKEVMAKPQIKNEEIPIKKKEQMPIQRVIRDMRLTLQSLFAKVSNAKPKKQMDRKRLLTIGAVTLIVVFLLGFGLWWYLPKAEVTIYVSPRNLSENVAISVDPDAKTFDSGKMVLPGTVLSISENGDKTTSTTGAKTVGERATGTVEIRNGTGTILNLKAGTIIASQDLGFTLDNAASVSAALSPGNPGTAEVGVTASDIGAEHNLPQDQTFTVSNYPKAEVDARAKTTFSGGSSREISAVSADDQENLLDELTDELSTKAKNELLTKITEEEYFLEETLTATASSRTFSDKIGDEADTLKLSLGLDVSALVVKKADLFALANEVLKDKMPEGYILRENQVKAELGLDKKDGDIYLIEGEIQVNLLPEINLEEIKKNIIGKYPPIAQDYLNTIPGFSRAQIVLSPQFPGRLGTLPHLVKRINIEIASEK